MGVVAWEERYSVGNERLDQQHQKIVGMINLLGEAMDAGTERPALMKILSDLAGYTKTHFAEEILMMEQCGYPKLDEHRTQHALLNRQLAEFYRNFYTISRPQSTEVIAFLLNWLYEHILQQDKQYAPYIGKTTKDRQAA
ncbi:MAG: bacteriohemerythrin [Desulfuromonadaceae bacterium]|nr:bacteriohemerythrin [Desulfuromonadaceae bacterium]